LNTNYQQPRRIINMMKVALVLLVATVLISSVESRTKRMAQFENQQFNGRVGVLNAAFPTQSAGNPVRNAKQFGNQSFNGGVGTVNQCATTGACQTGQNGNGNKKPPTIQGSNNFNGNVDQVHQCATTGSCHGQGKKKRSAIPPTFGKKKRSVIPEA